MEGPTPVSALLHAATMVAAGVYLVVRAYPIFAASEAVLTLMAYLGSFTAFFAAAIAMTQTDIKKVLAYSTCSQLGYMVAALGSGAMLGGYFHLTTHAFFKALLFLGAGSFIHATHSNEIHDMGLWGKMKVSSITFIIGAAALAGLPGMSGFFSKELILEELLSHDLFVPYALGLVTAGMTSFYMTKVVMVAIFGKPTDKAEHAHESPLSMVVPLVVLAVLAAGLGFLGGGMAAMSNAEYSFHFGAGAAAAVLVGLTGIGIGVYAYAPSRKEVPAVVQMFAPIGDFIRYGAVDRSAKWMYAEILQHTALAAGWFDRYIVDGLMNFTAWTLIHSGRRLRRLQTGVVSDYVYALVVGLILIVAVKTVVG
jgi:NADH-quinone oxidoreductase subunit L